MTAEVYQCFDGEGALLYVGVSLSTAGRMGAHRRGAGWWADVATITVEHLPDKAAALARETELIRSLRPRHNIVGIPPTPAEPIEVTVFGMRLPLGRAFKVERVAAGVSLSKVAAAVGVSPGHLCHIEADRRTASPELIERIRVAVRAAA